ncbi:MAG: hypothetical protein ACKVTZ_09575 [Bacteroidia bacterium]
MIKFFWFWIIIYPFFVFGQPNNQDSCCKSSLQVTKLANYSTKQVGKEFLRLRKLGCCSVFSGDLRPIMEELAVRMEKSQVSTRRLIKIMGKPNANEIPRTHGIIYSPQAGESLYIYHWRSWHDFLYFVVKDNRVRQAKWFYAYE